MSVLISRNWTYFEENDSVELDWPDEVFEYNDENTEGGMEEWIVGE
jgi:hypothetical protein